MKKMFMAVIALMMTLSASAQFYIYFSDGTAAKVDSISMIAPAEPENPNIPDEPTIESNEDELDNFIMGGYSIWDLGAPIAGTDTLLDLTGLGMTQCQLYEAYFLAWDENVVFDGNSFAGAGYVFEIAAPVYIITQEGEYQGAYINEGYVRIAELPEGVIASCVGTPGELVDLQKYGDAWKAINAFPEEPTDEEIDAAYSLYYDAQVGTQIFMIDFTSGSQSYYLGNVKSALLVDNDEDGFLYDLQIEWYDYVNEGRLYGLAYDEATETIVEPYDMRVINKKYTNMSQQEEVSSKAPSMLPKKNKFTMNKINKNFSNQPIKSLPKINK